MLTQKSINQILQIKLSSPAITKLLNLLHVLIKMSKIHIMIIKNWQIPNRTALKAFVIVIKITWSVIQSLMMKILSFIIKIYRNSATKPSLTSRLLLNFNIKELTVKSKKLIKIYLISF